MFQHLKGHLQGEHLIIQAARSKNTFSLTMYKQKIKKNTPGLYNPPSYSTGKACLFLKESKWSKWRAVILLTVVTIDVVYFNS